jgi:hypothetical protein
MYVCTYGMYDKVGNENQRNTPRLRLGGTILAQLPGLRGFFHGLRYCAWRRCVVHRKAFLKGCVKEEKMTL